MKRNEIDLFNADKTFEFRIDHWTHVEKRQLQIARDGDVRQRTVYVQDGREIVKPWEEATPGGGYPAAIVWARRAGYREIASNGNQRREA